jgi:hypothetical protein
VGLAQLRGSRMAMIPRPRSDTVPPSAWGPKAAVLPATPIRSTSRQAMWSAEPHHAEGMRPFTRLTNAFSKKVENLGHAASLHFMYYNFARPHKTPANPYPRTPAMAAGVADRVWKVEDIVALLG